MARKLFCQKNRIFYALSVFRLRLKRHLRWSLPGCRYAHEFSVRPLKNTVYTHKSLIRRTLGGVDMQLQENKAVNLSLAAPKINGILIKPGQVFSFWRTAGKSTRRAGYREGLVVTAAGPGRGIGGGMCQMTNLIYWLVLHSPLTVTERHHHALDLFPDFGRQVPFGMGTSVFYNYLDFQFKNTTQDTYQLLVRDNGAYLEGQLRCSRAQAHGYHIREEGQCFCLEDEKYYRYNRVYREQVDKRSGNLESRSLIAENRALVYYDEQYIPADRIRSGCMADAGGLGGF